MLRWILGLGAALAACNQLDTHDECVCGTAESKSQLSCSSKDLCEGAFELVGHTDLNARGMNSALAIAGNYAYIGSRTDGVTHDDASVAIVDISDPTSPQYVGKIGPPDEGVLGLSAREMRAVPDLHLLFVLNIACGTSFHDCSRNLNQYPSTGGIAETENLKIYDITDPVNPTLLSRYDFYNQPDSVPYAPPHEFFLWRDPTIPTRVVLFVTRINGPPSLEIIDASDPTAPKTLLTWDAFLEAGLGLPRSGSNSLHSLSVDNDGILYLAHYGAGFFMLDGSSITTNAPKPELAPLTPVDARITYSPPYDPWTHSAVRVPGRNLVLLTDEVYPVDAGDIGCPWGWGWMVDVTNPSAPSLFEKTDHATGEVTINGQLRLPWNEKSSCPSEALQRRTDYTAHNPTVTENLAILTWYGAGLQAFDISNPVHPVQVGAFYADPRPATVALEDPILSATSTEMWSYPIIRDGLIYVVDIRNGLYIVRYTGPHADEVSSRAFLDGSSNLQ